MTDWIKYDKKNFLLRKQEISSALNGATGMLAGVTEENKQEIFYMLLFCLCVPQSRAILAEEAIQGLRILDYYKEPIPIEGVQSAIRGLVRFQNTKAKRIVRAKREFESLWPVLCSYYASFMLSSIHEEQDRISKEARDWLASSIDGFGYKLASQFLRNVGIHGLAVLDVHVLRSLQERRLIDCPVKALTIALYCDIEKVMKSWAKRVGITIEELDLLWWSDRTGFVLK